MKKDKRLVGIDYGEARIGLSTAMENSMVAMTGKTVQATKDPQKNAQAVIAALTDYDVLRFVIGLPTHMDGRESPMSEKVRLFAKTLEEETNIPCDLWDERLSSKQVESLMREGGAKRKKRAEKTDCLSATLILQSYLESKLI